MRKCKLGDIAEFKTGPFGTQFKANEYTKTGTPVINVKNIGNGLIIEDELEYVSDNTKQRLSSHIIRHGDIVFARKGSVERHAYIDKKYDGWVQGSDCIKANISSQYNAEYVSYYLYLESVKKQLLTHAVGSTMPSMNTDILSDIDIYYPSDNDYVNQVVALLRNIKHKIALNNRINATLEAMAKTLYDYWFVQFDFPDEKGRPYKTSGGKMVYNAELGRKIPKGWEVKRLKEMVALFDSERIPLSSKERETKKGTIPYYGATGILDYVNEAIFDGDYILIAEDGSVETPDGGLVLQYIWGKAWINNHAHVLQGVFPYSTEYLFLALRYIKTKQLMTGSIQKKVTQDNLWTIKLPCPSDFSILEVFQKYIITFFARYKTCYEENRRLASLRDWLLPMLMNGQVGFRRD